jgi:hypothetical protein
MAPVEDLSADTETPDNPAPFWSLTVPLTTPCENKIVEVSNAGITNKDLSMCRSIKN